MNANDGVVYLEGIGRFRAYKTHNNGPCETSVSVSQSQSFLVLGEVNYFIIAAKASDTQTHACLLENISSTYCNIKICEFGWNRICV